MPGSLEDSKADVVVCFASYGMKSGFGWFDEIYEKAGPELKQAVARYRTLSVGSARLTPAFELRNFKAILHLVVPENLMICADYETVSSLMFYNIFQNGFNLAFEQGYRSIVIGATSDYAEPAWMAQFMLLLLQDYPKETFYFDKIHSIELVCSEDEYTYYSGFSADQAVDVGPAKPKRTRKRKAPNPISRDDLELMHSNGMYLVLSAKLELSILNLKDEDGKQRQYRMTNRSQDGHKLYFRCSKCDTLANKELSSERGRLIIAHGEISNEEPPYHHPDCEPWTAEQLLVQQIDRASRKAIKDGLLLPFEAYQNALYRIASTMGGSTTVKDPVLATSVWRSDKKPSRSVAAGGESDDDYIEIIGDGETIEYVGLEPRPPHLSRMKTVPGVD